MAQGEWSSLGVLALHSECFSGKFSLKCFGAFVGFWACSSGG